MGSTRVTAVLDGPDSIFNMDVQNEASLHGALRELAMSRDSGYRSPLMRTRNECALEAS